MKKLSKRLLSVLLVIAMLIPTGAMVVTTSAAEESIKIGDKIVLGSYDGNPINWICVDIDENGPLMLTEDVLCLKEFDAAGDNSTYHSDGWGYIRKERGSNNWQDSNIRQWLNSTGTVDYTHCPPSYKDEPGFMSNFTTDELRFVKPTYHNVNIVKYDSGRTGYCDGGSSDSCSITSSNFVATNNYYKRVEDSFMLLDSQQFNNIYKTNPQYLKSSKDYLLSSSFGNNYACFELVTIATAAGGVVGAADWACNSSGIRPAFYLDVDAWNTIEQTISGILTGSSTDNRISVNGNWYEYDTSIPGLAEAIDRFAINETITCKIKFGKIVACSKKEIRNSATLSVNTSNNNITYDASTKKYNSEKIALNINIANTIVASQYGKINTEYVAGYDITFDKLEINAYDGDMLYFKDGWFGLGKTQLLEKGFDSPVTLKAGETFNFSDDLTAFINDDYKWGDAELKKDVTIFAYAYNGDTIVATNTLTITFKNQTAESSIKSNTELNKKIQNAANLLDKTTGVIYSPYLEELLTKDVLIEATNELKCKVALSSIILKAKKNETLEDKLIDKLMKKAGISKEWMGTVYTADIKHSEIVDTKEYGKFEVEFNIKLTNISIGNGNPYAGFSFDTTYNIKGGKNIKERTGSVTSYFGYADIQTFANSVEEVALEQIEYAYDLGYGDDLNEVCEMFFDETITLILSKTKAESYSHVFYESMTYPSKQMNVHCPVDIFIYDAEGTLCASVENNEITMTCDDIDIEVVGDEKYLTIYDGDYSIEIIATANDEMDIEIEEYSSKDRLLRTTTFNNIALAPGDSFKTYVDENYVDNEYQITKNEEDIISAGSDKGYIHYVDAVEIIDKEATCTEDGEYHIECAECEETVLTGIIPAIGHSDTNHDGICDNCGHDFTVDCGHSCHSDNAFIRFFWKIINFLQMLFGVQSAQYCNCGQAHW